MTVTWALVADRSQARILEHRGPKKGLVVVEDIQHPQGHFQDKDTNTDRHGSGVGGAGRHHTMDSRESPHDHIAGVFAKDLAERLRLARVANKYERLVLAAEPTFLGRIRAALDEPTRRLVTGEIPKHLLGAGDRSLEAQLGELIRL